jgi:hypothetical protein
VDGEWEVKAGIEETEQKQIQPGGPEIEVMKNDSVTLCLQQEIMEQFPSNHMAKSRGLKKFSVTTLTGTAELNKLLGTTHKEMMKVFLYEMWI